VIRNIEITSVDDPEAGDRRLALVFGWRSHGRLVPSHAPFKSNGHTSDEIAGRLFPKARRRKHLRVAVSQSPARRVSTQAPTAWRLRRQVGALFGTGDAELLHLPT
jgi:hypothetical protein